MGQRLWVMDEALAIVEDGRVTLQVDRPTRHLPREQAFHVADKIWFAGQMRQLEIARQRAESKVIPLTDRRRRSSLRMGGGFMITQGSRLVVVRRLFDAPRPGQLCECGGVFEFLEPDLKKDPENVRNDYVASLLKESQEIALVRGNILFIPQLAPWPSEQIGFQPPGTLDAYNNIIEEELKRDAIKANPLVKQDLSRYFWIKMLDYEHAVRLEFAYSPALSVEVTAEIDTSSLECVGVLSFPENVDIAVTAYLEEKLQALRKKESKEPDETKRRAIRKEIKEVNRQVEEARKKTTKASDIAYWDCELGWDPVIGEESGPIDRDVHLIDTETGTVIVWYNVKVKGKRRREARASTLWKELSATRLGPAGTGGRLATEKLERAIKMHCPLTHLQPLVTY